MHKAVETFLPDIDLDHVHPDLAHTLCKRVGSLFLISFPDWLKYSSMPLPALKEHLNIYAKKNAISINHAIDPPEDLSYEEIESNKDTFHPQLLARASDVTIRRMIIEAYQDVSLPLDQSSLDHLDKNQLVCELYNTMQVIREHKANLTVDLTSPDSFESDTKQTPKVTPLKRRQPRSPEASPSDIDSKMDTSDDNWIPNDIHSQLLSITFSRLELLTFEDIVTYINYLDKTYKENLPSDYFDTVPLCTLRDNLFMFVLELHSLVTPSHLHDDISRDDIEYLEPIMAYHE